MRSYVTQPDLLCSIPKAGSQCYALLAALQNGERLTVAIALERYGVYALSQRCGELKRMGWPITSEMVTTPTGKRVAEYRL